MEIFDIKWTPALTASLLLCQRAQEEVHSKELKVKLLTDSVNSFIAKAPPTAHDALRSELDVLTANYQRLCSRLDGKCKTLEVGFVFCPLCPHTLQAMLCMWADECLIYDQLCFLQFKFVCYLEGVIKKEMDYLMSRLQLHCETLQGSGGGAQRSENMSLRVFCRRCGRVGVSCCLTWSKRTPSWTSWSRNWTRRTASREEQRSCRRRWM